MLAHGSALRRVAARKRAKVHAVHSCGAMGGAQAPHEALHQGEADMKLAGSFMTGGYLHSAYFWMSVVGMGASDAVLNAATKSRTLARAVVNQNRGEAALDQVNWAVFEALFRFSGLAAAAAKRLQLKHPFALYRGALQLAHLQRAHRWQREGVESRVRLDGAKLYALDRLMQFSAAAYGWKTLRFLGLGRPGMRTNRRGIELLTGVAARDIWLVQDTSRMFRPGHFVCVDHATQNVVVTIRGTMRLQDVVTDLSCADVPFSLIDPMTGEHLHGSAHGGFLLAAQNVKAEVQDSVVAALREHPAYGLQVTGHSLGGACATLLALLWAQDPALGSHKVRAVSFAAPCCLSHALARSKYCKERVTSVVLGDDFVCRLSIVSVEGFFRTCDELVRLAREGSLCEGSGRDALERVRAEAQARRDRLFPGGRVLHIPLQSRYDPARFDVYMAEEVDPALSLSEIILTPKMIKIHLPSRYLNALRRQRLIHLHGAAGAAQDPAERSLCRAGR